MHPLQEQAYLLGRQLAFEKVATSRWREAIRSGEVGEDTANKIRQGMKFNPYDWENRLARGAQKMTENAGFKAFQAESLEKSEDTFGTMLKRMWDERSWAPMRQAVRKNEAYAASLNGRMGGFMVPEDREIFLSEHPGAGRGMEAMHEAHEARIAGKSKPTSWSSRALKLIRGTHGDDGYQQVLPYDWSLNLAKERVPVGATRAETLRALRNVGRVSQNHMSAELPIQDIREMRMFGRGGTEPQADAEKLLKARNASGEMHAVTEASKNVTGQGGYLPRRNIRSITKEMTRRNEEKLMAPYIPDLDWVRHPADVSLYPRPTIEVHGGPQGVMFPGSGKPKPVLPNKTMFEILTERALEAAGISKEEIAELQRNAMVASKSVPKAVVSQELFPKGIDKLKQMARKAMRRVHV